MQQIYLDASASTPLLPAVWEAMRPYCFEAAANPASSHRPGQKARKALEDAREQVAQLLDALPEEVIFTSGATEANNLALFGLAGSPPGQLLLSPLEHPCVLEPARHLEQLGFRLDWLPVNGEGIVHLQTSNIPETRLAALMLANHETGALQPVEELAQLLPGEAALHCDAAAAVGKIPVSFRQLGTTTMTLSAHKFHGPKGVGALLVRKGTRLRPLFFGGHQQQGRRPGTEPVHLAVGLAMALSLATSEMTQRQAAVRRLRQQFLDGLRTAVPPVIVNGPAGGIPHILNLSFPGCRADVLLMNLDLVGIACSTGSACSSGSLLPSPVLKAMKVEEARLQSAMRFSFSHLLTEAEIDQSIQRISEVVRRLRIFGQVSR